MSLVDVKGVNLVPGFLACPFSGTYALNTTMDAAGELCGSVLEIPKTGNISKIGFRTGTVTVSDTLKISLQTVDEATGRPTGTLIHADAYGTQAGLAANTTYWVSLQNDVAVTRGDIVAPVVEFNSYVAGNLRITRSIGNSGFENFPYVFEYVGSVWTFSSSPPNFGIEYDDGVIEPINITLPAVLALTPSWDTNDNPDRRGLRFSVPYNCRLSGIFALIYLPADANIEIYDSDGTTIIPDGTISMDANLAGSAGAKPIVKILTTPIELTKDTFYRIVLHPTTGTNINLYVLDVTNDGANEAMNAIDGGVNFHYTTCHGSPSVEGNWTQTATKRPLIGIMIDQLESADYPMVGNVRDGTDYNNATQEGTLDLPAVTDVEKSVKFDNETKTGTFKEPGVANVAEGVKYGAGDTEFTGTFVRNAITGAVVVGQSTAGTVEGD